MTRIVVVRPHEPGALVLDESELDAWAAAEVRSGVLGPIDNPAYEDRFALTNLIGEGYRFEPVVSSWTEVRS